MKRSKAILCLLLAALLCGCGKPDTTAETPTEPTTERSEAIPSESQSPLPDETTSSVDTTEPHATVTVPSEIPTTSETQETTAATVPLITEPDSTPAATVCGHDYQPGFDESPTCEQAGYQSYHCRKCGDVQQQFTLPLGHSYEAATCTSAKQCSRCNRTDGVALGHDYVNGHCRRCGEKDPGVRFITIQVTDSKNTPVDGVAVALYLADSLHSTAVSAGGQVSFTVYGHTGSYQLVLTEIPEGYKAQKDSYTYRSDNGAIVLDIVPVIYPEDHSKAAYKVGSTMGDFSVTDVDGKTYQLSQLLQEKKLVILNFWYFSCVPCKAEFPYFNSIYQRYSEDLEILALNHFDSASLIRQLRTNMDLQFPLATEHLGMQQGFGIQSYPMTVFIGSDGRILYIQKDMGFRSEEDLDALVRQMIGK